MNSMILDGTDSLIAAWPLAVVAIVIAWLVGTAFVRAGRPTETTTKAWGDSVPSLTCRSSGHRYLKGATGWQCSHCGEQIRREGHAPQRSRQAVGV